MNSFEIANIKNRQRENERTRVMIINQLPKLPLEFEIISDHQSSNYVERNRYRETRQFIAIKPTFYGVMKNISNKKKFIFAA